MFKISEAFTIFRMQDQFMRNKESVIEMEKQIDNLGNLNVPGFFPNISRAWQESKKYLSSKEFSYDSLCFEEVLIDFLMRSVLNGAFNRLREVVENDLARLFHQLHQGSWYGYQKLKFAKNTDEILSILREYAFGFQIQGMQTWEDHEIFAVRTAVLGRIIRTAAFDSLRSKGEMLDPPTRSLHTEVKEILDFIVSLGKVEYYHCLRYQHGMKELFVQLEKAKEKGGEKRFELATLTSLIPSQTEALQTKEKMMIKVGPTALMTQHAATMEIQELWTRYEKTLSVQEAEGVKRLRSLMPLGRIIPDIFSRNIFTKLAGIGGFVKDIVPLGLSFFQGGVDASSQRYQSIMKGFQEREKERQVLFQNESIMYKQLLEIDQKIGAIAKNQIALGKSIVGLAHLIEAQHQETMTALASIQHDVVINRMVLTSMLDRSGKMCREARFELMRFNGYLPYFNRFNSYEKCCQFYQRERFSLKEGLRGLLGLLMRPGEDDVALVVSPERSSVEVLFFEHYRALWKIIQNSISWEGFKTFEYLLETQINVDQLDPHVEVYQKIDHVKTPKWIEERLKWIDMDSLMRSPYDMGRLLDYCESARCFHYFYELFKNDIGGPLVNRKELLTHIPSPYGERLLQDALIRIEIGILQLNLISGFGVIPFLYQKMQKEKLETIASLLGPNQMLAKNFMVYAFRKKMKEKNHPYSDYWSPYRAFQSPALLKRLVGEEWNFVWDEKREKWMVKLLEKREPIEIPHPVELMHGTLEAHPQLGDLHMMRKKLLRELAGYRSIDHKEKEDYAVTLLNSMYFRHSMTTQEDLQSKL